ncbi:MAG: SDR family NAD(P)-dependent oxidoreductase, partial [Clostridia bacterium]|nr:SDR family NAD(P)-dependent oxidoreductase [Clostridia bacterium]
MKVLDNKVCVVTGAGGVLCSSFAEELAKNGANVALLDLNKDAAQAVADKINAEGG